MLVVDESQRGYENVTGSSPIFCDCYGKVIRIWTTQTSRDGLSRWQQANKKLCRVAMETGKWHDSQTRLSLGSNGKWASLNHDSKYFHCQQIASAVKIFIWTERRIQQGPLGSPVDWTEQDLTSHQTHYRSYGGRPNQQCQSTEER